jgi:cytidyltransferase-like protein
VILTSGAFDGVHAGHVDYLNAAKALCDDNEILVCAVAPDEYIIKAKKRQPFWHQADRLRTIHALESVDAAIPQISTSVVQIIERYRPRLFVKGPDWDGRLSEEIVQACDRIGCAIAFVDTEGRHTSEAMGA